MKLSKILLSVGEAALSTIIPGAGAIISGINEFLPDDKKLPETTTGKDAISKINTLSPEQQTQVLNKEYDIEIAEINSWEKIQVALSKADESGNTTRPAIALYMAYIVSYSVVISISMLAYAVIVKDPKLIDSVKNVWPLVLAIIGTPVTLLRYYFGKRTEEKHSRYSSITNVPNNQNGILGTLIKGFTKK